MFMNRNQNTGRQNPAPGSYPQQAATGQNPTGYGPAQGYPQAGYGQPQGYPMPGAGTVQGYPQQIASGQQAGAFQGQGYSQPQSFPQGTGGYPMGGLQGQPAMTSQGSVRGFSNTGSFAAQNGASVQNGSGMGYGASPQGYGAFGQNYGQSAPAAQNGYPAFGQVQQGYGQPAGGFGTGSMGYPQSGAGGYGQNTAGGVPQGYPQMQGYPNMNTTGQGYGAYAQMGRPAQGPGTGNINRQIPMNGAGYIPQSVPVRKQPFTLSDPILILISALLLILFAAGMFLPGLGMLKWVFLALAVCSVAALWIRPMTESNKRLCYTIVFAALTLVAAVSLAMPAGRSTDVRDGTRASAVSGSPVQGVAVTDQPATLVVDGVSGQVISSIAPPDAVQLTPEPMEDTAAQDRLVQFFQFWRNNQTEEMLTLCLPSWQSSVENPKAALFALLANRTPEDFTFEQISGTNDDTSRTVTFTTRINRNNGKPSALYRMNVRMVKENGEWYVDPQSLKSYESAETTDPASAETPTPSPTPPTPAGTILYYNTEGGTKYHLDPNCSSTHKKYLPMKGHFTYAEINDDAYKALKPCNVCNAPLR